MARTAALLLAWTSLWIAPVSAEDPPSVSDPTDPSTAKPAMSAEEIRGVVSEALADAETRESLTSPVGVGFDGRFFVEDKARGFRLTFTGEFQGRYQANFGANGGPGADDSSEFESGFMFRNLRLDFRGSLFDDSVSFRVMPAVDPTSGEIELLDAFLDVSIEDVDIRIGQFSLLFTREYIVSPTQQLAAERSLTDSVFRLGRSQGIMAMRTWDRFRVFGAFTDGARALNTDFDSDSQADAALTGRAELRLLDGSWHQFAQAFCSPEDKPGLLLGAAAHWQHGGETTAPSSYGDDATMVVGTADLTWKAAGWTAMAEGVTRYIAGDDDQSTVDYGLVAHIGALVTDHIELFARYTHIWPGSDRTGGTADLGTVELGGSWYLVPGSRVCRVTVQGIWVPEPQSASDSIVSAPNIPLAIEPDSSGGQVGVIVQVQVVF